MSPSSMHKLVLIMIAFWAVLPSPAMAQVQPAFRDFVWGVNEDDVKTFESARFYEKRGDSLLFLEQPDEFRRLITYDFKDQKLWRAKYEYVEFHTDGQSVLNLVLETEIALMKQYGKPSKEEFLWKDKTYRYYPQFWYRALVNGDLRLKITWEFKDTRVELQTYRDKDLYQFFYTAEQMSVADTTKNTNYLNLMPKP